MKNEGGCYYKVFVNFRLDMGVNEILHIRIKSGMKQIIFIPILKLVLKMNRKSRHLLGKREITRVLGSLFSGSLLRNGDRVAKAQINKFHMFCSEWS